MKPEPDLYGVWQDWAKALLLWLAGDTPVTETQVTSASLGLPVGVVMDNAAATVPQGWLLCDGREVSRTDYAQLWLAIGTLYGVPTSGSVFRLPDGRDRVRLGRGNMGGAAAGRVTVGVAGLNTSTLGATGGSQNFQQHDHGVGVTDPGHIHGITDTGHTHTVTDLGHAHGITDNGHAHGYNTPNVDNSMAPTLGGSSLTYTPGRSSGTTAGQTTGITVNSSTTGISLVSNTTGVGVVGNSTGITVDVQDAGVGAAGNIPPCIVMDMIIYAGV